MSDEYQPGEPSQAIHIAYVYLTCYLSPLARD
jgi:hypothetical protein